MFTIWEEIQNTYEALMYVLLYQYAKVHKIWNTFHLSFCILFNQMSDKNFTMV